MPDHSYFGLKLISPVKFDALPSSDTPASNDDVIFNFGYIKRKLESPVFHSPELEIDQTKTVLLREPKIGSCIISNGTDIVFQPQQNADERSIQSLILTTIASAILHQRSELALHACCVIFNGKAIAVCGPPERGKSTLAAMLVREGGILLSEDISVVRFINGLPHVVLGPQAIKLYPDNARLISVGDTHGFVAKDHPKVFWNQIRSAPPAVALLDFVVRLEIEDEKHPSGTSKLDRLPLDVLYGLNVCYHMGRLEPSYEQVQKIGKVVPIFELRRPRDIRNLHVAFRFLAKLLQEEG